MVKFYSSLQADLIGSWYNKLQTLFSESWEASETKNPLKNQVPKVQESETELIKHLQLYTSMCLPSEHMVRLSACVAVQKLPLFIALGTRTANTAWVTPGI